MGCLGVSRTRCERNRVGRERRPDDAGVAAGRAAVAILLALTMPVSAEVTDSANFLLPGCKALSRERESTPEWRRILCLAYIQGLVSGVGGKETCPPKEVTGDQVVAVVVKYIEARPERMHEQFGKLALEALEEAWPCKR